MFVQKVTAESLEAGWEDRPLVLASWRRQGKALVAEHDAEYRALLARIDPLIEAKRFREAAAAAQAAANHAVLWHTGRFVCPDLEASIARLAEAALPHPGSAPRRDEARGPLRVLHVATEMHSIGGHSRNAARWMAQDSGNRHSLALTRQHDPIPADIVEAVAATGGEIVQLNQRRGGLLDWARLLQDRIAAADVVVMHVHSMDVIPFLACGGMASWPPVLYVNHADHLFWVGARFVDLVVSSRRSGNALCLSRRGINPDRTALLPLCLNEAGPRPDREASRRALGIAEDHVVILTVARGLKFKPVGGEEFPDPLVPLLRRNPNVRLMVVGAGGEVDWSVAEAQVPGQIRAIPATREPGPYFAAGDIYLDSFPFASITSLLEAGLTGLPLVTRNPFGPDCDIMGADTLGFDGSIVRVSSSARLPDALQALIDDPQRRRALGASTRAEITGLNLGEGWRKHLAATYERVFLAMSRPRAEDRAVDRGPSDLDCFIPFVFEDRRRGATEATRLMASIEPVIKAAPLGWRLRTLAELRRQGSLRALESRTARDLLPEWLGARIRAVQRRLA